MINMNFEILPKLCDKFEFSYAMVLSNKADLMWDSGNPESLEHPSLKTILFGEPDRVLQLFEIIVDYQIYTQGNTCCIAIHYQDWMLGFFTDKPSFDLNRAARWIYASFKD